MDFAVVLAEAYLDALAGATRDELARYLGRPAEQLIMGGDRRPYVITAIAVQRADGKLYLHVGVSSGDWDDAVPVVRSTVVTFGRDGRARAVIDVDGPGRER